MTREEFNKMFKIDEQTWCDEIVKKNKLREVVKAGVVHTSNRYRNLEHAPVSYQMKYFDIVDSAIKRRCERYDNLTEEEAKELLEKTQIMKELVKRGYKVIMRIVECERWVEDILHHIDYYAEFETEVEAEAMLSKRYKQKLFVFVDDGVFTIKTPPATFDDIGIFDKGDCIEYKMQ